MARFTAKYMENLKPKEKEYIIAGGDGLYVRVFPDGRKVLFYYFVSPVHGTRRKYKLGEWPRAISLQGAKEKMNKAYIKVTKNIDPIDDEREEKKERIEALTVSELAKEYLEKWAKRQRRSHGEDERILTKDILPRWGKRKARDITRRDVLLLLEEIGERGPVIANRVRSLLHIMFRIGVERDIVPANPVSTVRRLFKEDSKDRFLSEEEILTFWNGLDDDSAPASEEVKRALKFILATGARPGEVAGLMWEEIEPSGEWWNLPPERAKNGKGYRIYLSRIARELIGERPDNGGPVFPSPSSNPKKKGQALAVRSLSRVVRRAEYFSLEPFTPHDLRRTTASHMTKLGVQRFLVGQVLGHSERGITGVYDRHDYDNEKRKASEKWARRLVEMIEGKAEGKIIPIKS